MKTTTITLLMVLSTLTQVASASETIKCVTEVFCATYENGKEIGPSRCIGVNNGGDIKEYVKERMTSELNIENDQYYSTDFSHKFQKDDRDLFGQSPGKEWNYLVIQAHDIKGNDDQYNLRAGILFTRSEHPVDGRDLQAVDRHMNLKNMIDDKIVTEKKFINIVQNKDEELVITKQIMVPLDYHEHGVWIRNIKDTVKTLIAMPLITFNSLTQDKSEKKCGGEIARTKKEYKRPGTTLMAKTLKITCSPAK